MGDYAEERYNPRFSSCGQMTLLFDGSELTLSHRDGVERFRAVSGKSQGGSYDYSIERQKIRNVGPIPAGSYWIRLDEVDDNFIKASLSDKFERSWGRYRVSIHPYDDTNTYGRGGFFIHGGTKSGSAGCIDLTTEMERFIEILKRLGFYGFFGGRRCYIHLEVRYSGMGDYPQPRRGTATA